MEILEPIDRSKNLINAEECFILIIDVQTFFMQGMSPKQRDDFIKKTIHLIQIASLLNIPLIVTAEDVKKNGTVPNKIVKALPKYVQIYDKFIYSCWGQENIQDAINHTKRKTVIMCGLETDVCVMQTAIDLLDNGFRVVVLTDITYSRNMTEHKIGLKRMEYNGAIFSILKSWQEEISAGIRTKINFDIKKHGLNEI
ncbi:MAG: isochorismatase family protein [Candidatus Hodarchaeales archaeon]|jgi:nicotinamidase-related amidase